MNARIIQLPRILDARGNLSFAENLNQIPFEIKRTYWLYDVPGAVCLVLASEVYQTQDYIRDYQEFLLFREKQ